MHSVKSVHKGYIKNRGWIYGTHSPVTCERTTQAFIAAVGPKIKIDGNVFTIGAVEMFMPGRPLDIGEPIGILVKENECH
jgi:hypothetical protein